MRFVIISAPRSGSTHLVDILVRHPRIACHGEVFANNRVRFWRNNDPGHEALEEELRALRESDIPAFLERIFALNMGRDHVGFKIFENHGDGAMARLLEDTGVRKIFLYRENLLAAFASSLTSKATGVWGRKKRSSAEERPSLTFVAKRFEAFHDRRVGFFRDATAQLSSSGQHFCWLPYAQLNDPSAILNLLVFIGATPELHKAGLLERKGAPSKVTDRFDNSAEVEAYLSERNLQHWTYEAEQTLEPLGS